jgi:hypothetical protein
MSAHDRLARPAAPGRRLPALAAALFVLCAALPSAVALATTPSVERSDATIAADGLKRLRVENSRGRIEVRPSADGKLHVTAIKTIRAGRQGKVEEYRRQTSVSAERQGDTYAITVQYPKRIDVQIDFWDIFRSHRGDDPFITRIDMALVIEAPRSIIVETHGVSGDAVTEGMAGPQELSTTSGDLTVRKAAGPVHAATTSGDIIVDEAAAVQASSASGDIDARHLSSLVAHSTSGDIDVVAVTDSVRIESASGDVQADSAPKGAWVHTVSGGIDVRGAGRRVNAESSSGEITLGLVAPLTSVDAHAASGSVSVLLPLHADADVDLQTTSGDVTSAAGLVLQQHSEHSLRGRLGKGGAPVRIRTASGDISVKSEGR